MSNVGHITRFDKVCMYRYVFDKDCPLEYVNFRANELQEAGNMCSRFLWNYLQKMCDSQKLQKNWNFRGHRNSFVNGKPTKIRQRDFWPRSNNYKYENINNHNKDCAQSNFRLLGAWKHLNSTIKSLHSIQIALFEVLSHFGQIRFGK